MNPYGAGNMTKDEQDNLKASQRTLDTYGRLTEMTLKTTFAWTFARKL